MSDRVRCSHCGGTYDLARVKVIARYADCSIFDAPCCGHHVDDRAWLGHFTREPAGPRTDYRGRVYW